MMGRSKTRKLWKLDNLEGMPRITKGSIALIYMDPPFNSGRSYEAIWSKTRQAGSNAAFNDSWAWSDEARGSFSDSGNWLEEETLRLLRAIVKSLGECQTSAYLAMMAPRLAEAHRVLRDDGSLYVHCDPSASHYLKLLLDSLFGPENFRNEIIWKRTHAHSSSRRYGPIHDTILFYSKGPRYIWNPVFTRYSENYLAKHFRNRDERGQYQLITCTAPGDRQGTRAHYQWRGQEPPPGRHWAWRRERMEAFEREGRLVHSSTGVPRLKRYADDGKGVLAQDLWLDINRLDSHSQERVGFETQKPLALLERLITASSNPGDLVLDPFGGSGTTAVAAERLKRGWIIMDASLMACATSLARVRQEINLQAVALEGFPSDDAAARRLLKQEPLAFGLWGISMLATLPDRKETNGSIMTGTGRLKVKSRQLELLSWVPLSKHPTVRIPSGRSRSLSKIGLVLQHNRTARQVRQWLQDKISIPLREVAIENLVDPQAIRAGMATGVRELARPA